MNRKLRNILALAGLLFCASSYAQDGSIPLLQQGLIDALNNVFTWLQGAALKWLGMFMILQFVWTHWQLILGDSDIPKVFAKLAASLFWFGICIFIFENGADFIKNVSSEIMSKAVGATGMEFDPIYPIHKGIEVASQLLESLNSAGGGILQALNIFPSIMMGLVSVVILATSALLAFKILMVFIETKMVIALSPLSFALLGLNAFRDQGLAPFKYIVSMAIRMFLYGAVLAAMEIFSTSIIAAFKALPAASDPSVWPPIWAAAMGYLLMGAVALRVDSIAAMLSSGSSQMSTGDAAAVGAVAGAAAGLAAAGATKAAGVAAKPAQAMADFMKGQGGGEVKNAGGAGGGQSGGGLAGLATPLQSKGGAGGGKEKGGEFAVNKYGAPVKASAPAPASSAATSAGGGAGGGGEQVDTGGNGLASRSPEGSLAKIADAETTMAPINDAATKPSPDSMADKSINTGDSVSGVVSNAVTAGNAAQQPAFKTNSKGAPVRPTSASGAGIGGAPAAGQQSQALGAEKKQGDAQPSTARDHWDKLGRGLIEDSAPVHVQMNTHQGD